MWTEPIAETVSSGHAFPGQRCNASTLGPRLESRKQQQGIQAEYRMLIPSLYPLIT